jgi:hypothetical protein
VLVDVEVARRGSLFLKQAGGRQVDSEITEVKVGTTAIKLQQLLGLRSFQGPGDSTPPEGVTGVSPAKPFTCHNSYTVTSLRPMQTCK